MKDNATFPASIILSAIILATSIIYHANTLSGKSLTLDSFKKTADVNVAEPANPTAPKADAPQFAKVSLDDDPIMGDPNAPVTLIEFSDYECPFCQRHYQNTMPEIVKNYIDTGKVKLVFRDLPLSFHDPMATKAANAANCVKEQKGDTGYYSFHSSWFANTPSNGTGFNDEKINEFAVKAGVDLPSFSKCVADGKYNEEVKADLAAASTYGASATPSFFVGKSSGSEIEAEMIIGAQPFSAFQTAIDKYLE